MWLAPFVRSGSQSVTLTLPPQRGRPPVVACVRVWNYNKNVSDSFRGARRMRVTLDGRPILPPQQQHHHRYCDEDSDGTFLLRKAPGISLFDFGQVVWLQPPCDAHHAHLVLRPFAPTPRSANNANDDDVLHGQHHRSASATPHTAAATPQ